MALNYFIDSRQRLVIVTAEGEITRRDAETYIEAVVGANALDYRKLFDWRAGVPAMDPEELMSIVVQARGYHERPHGALAIVLTERQRQSPQLLRLLGVLASARRPMRVFGGVRAARNWLRATPLPP
jgi:hypothetical protein